MKNNTVSNEELSLFCRQMALVLGAGIGIREGLESILSDSASDLYQKLIDNLSIDGTLASALREDPVWPVYLSEMVGLGERTGRLEQVLLQLASHYENEEKMHSAARNAVAYPLVLGTMLVVIILVMLWRVLPVFKRVLSSIGINESGSVLMRFGENAGWIVLAIVGILGFGVILLLILSKTKAKSKTIAFLKKVSPSYASFKRKLSAARIASVISLMLSSALPVEEAIDALPSVLDDKEAMEKVKVLRSSMEAGDSFSDALEKALVFDTLQTRMIRMGIAAGKEDEIMQSVSNTYEEQTEESVAKVVSIIEPTLVALLSIVIGAILLSVMLPMVGILSSLI